MFVVFVFHHCSRTLNLLLRYLIEAVVHPFRLFSYNNLLYSDASKCSFTPREESKMDFGQSKRIYSVIIAKFSKLFFYHFLLVFLFRSYRFLQFALKYIINLKLKEKYEIKKRIFFIISFLSRIKENINKKKKSLIKYYLV